MPVGYPSSRERFSGRLKPVDGKGGCDARCLSRGVTETSSREDDARWINRDSTPRAGRRKPVRVYLRRSRACAIDTPCHRAVKARGFYGKGLGRETDTVAT
ncbi:hypothetical protein PUN28_003821 [Cardiocondyla obscurior]|uniref:Uncharacterized protein n=1 Tax=Cardiocondyla obscurior TaxID=286306 RepID=A0AAW2GL09_9HYME